MKFHQILGFFANKTQTTDNSILKDYYTSNPASVATLIEALGAQTAEIAPAAAHPFHHFLPLKLVFEAFLSHLWADFKN